MKTLFYRITTFNNKVLIIKVEEHYNGLFGQNTEWEIYYKQDSFWGSAFTYLTKTPDRDRIGEMIRMHFDVKKIEAI